MNNNNLRRVVSGSALFLPGAAAILLAAAIVAEPEASFEASLQGLQLWWTIVFPALLPFLILSEMLTASGLVHGFGVLLEPMMRKLFRLPGAGGWTLALGITAGFPAGAGGVMQLHKQGSITDDEAGRLASLSHFASPVTIILVVGVAFLHDPFTGYVLLAIHWLAGLAANLTASQFFRNPRSIPARTKEVVLPKLSLSKRVHSAATEARSRDGRSFGKLLGESVSSAVQSLMIIGGYMIIFAVIISIVNSLFPILPPALSSGLLEIHLGANTLTSGTANLNPLSSMGLTGLAFLSALLGWSGLCAQLQTLSILRQAGVRFMPYAAVRLIHGLYAFLFTLLSWHPLQNLHHANLPAITAPAAYRPLDPLSHTSLWSAIPHLAGMQFLVLLLLLFASGCVYAVTCLSRPSR